MLNTASKIGDSDKVDDIDIEAGTTRPDPVSRENEFLALTASAEVLALHIDHDRS